MTTDLYRDDKGKSGTVHLDFIVPLRPGTDTDLQNLTVVMRTDLTVFCFPLSSPGQYPVRAPRRYCFAVRVVRVVSQRTATPLKYRPAFAGSG